MIENIINDHGGLHDRITHTIYLRQFLLAETEAYLKSRKILWPRLTIVEAYMMLGGVPYYLSLLNPSESLAQNIDRIYFRKNSELGQEYRRLYSSLFKAPDPYIRIVEVLSKNKQGMTRNEIADSLKMSSSGTLSKHLENLEYCDIIRRYVTKVGGKPKTNEAYFQLVDLFTLFHLTFSKKLTTEDYWEQHLNTPVINTWQGLAFEHVCMVHINQIRHALGLDRIAVEYYSWRSSTPPHAQVDMIIERADHLINLCEIKYTQAEYVITSDESQPGWMVSFQEDTYRFLVDPASRKVTGELMLPWNAVFIAGSAFEGGANHVEWNRNGMLPFERDHDNPYVFSWTGELGEFGGVVEPGRFKLEGQMTWGPRELHPYVQDEDLLSSTQMRQGGDDTKWHVYIPGTYHIVVDLFNETFHAELIAGANTYETDGVDGIDGTSDGMPTAVYNMGGVRMPSLQKGLNIVRTSDGKVRKIYCK